MHAKICRPFNYTKQRAQYLIAHLLPACICRHTHYTKHRAQYLVAPLIFNYRRTRSGFFYFLLHAPPPKSEATNHTLLETPLQKAKAYKLRITIYIYSYIYMNRPAIAPDIIHNVLLTL